MQAVILSAGLGTRLRPLTDTVPKCMIPINGKPVLQYNIEHLKEYGIYDIIINLHYLPDVVPNYFGNGFRFGVNITYSFESEILGTSGTIKSLQSKLDSTFLVVYGDNINTCNIYKVIAFHKAKKGKGTIVLHHRDDVTNSGVVLMDKNRKITRFIEKPKKEELLSKRVNAGFYVLEPEIIDIIPDGYSDFGKDVFPKALELDIPLYGYNMFLFEHLYWIDTLEDLSYTSMLLRCNNDNCKSSL